LFVTYSRGVWVWRSYIAYKSDKGIRLSLERAAKTNKTADVLIVGAGIIGAATAWQLRDSGLSVAIVGVMLPMAPVRSRYWISDAMQGAHSRSPIVVAPERLPNAAPEDAEFRRQCALSRASKR